MIDVKIEANDAMRRLLELAGSKGRRLVAAAVNEAAVVGVAAIAGDTPVRTARLRNSIAITQRATADDPTAVISTAIEYAAAVEWGTGVHSEFPGSDKQPIRIAARESIDYQAFKRRKPGRKRRTVAVRAHQRGRSEHTRQGQKPAAMFRKNLQKIEDALVAALKHRIQFLDAGS